MDQFFRYEPPLYKKVRFAENTDDWHPVSVHLMKECGCVDEQACVATVTRGIFNHVLNDYEDLRQLIKFLPEERIWCVRSNLHKPKSEQRFCPGSTTYSVKDGQSIPLSWKSRWNGGTNSESRNTMIIWSNGSNQSRAKCFT